MQTVSLSGKALARQLDTDTASQASALQAARGRPVRLVLVVANQDPASAWYVGSLRKKAARLGIDCQVRELGAAATVGQIRGALSEPGDTDAIMLQTPLPAGIHLDDVSDALPASKDVDGVSPLSLGLLAMGKPGFAPATAEAVVRLLRHHQIELAGRHAVVVGRSNVVGKPLAQLLLAENATVTVCHSRTVDLPAVTTTGDVVIAAAGRIGLVTGRHIRPGAVVVDVGTNEGSDGAITGDVDAESVQAVAGALSPVPGGVGPVTTALLMRHVVEAAYRG